MWSIRDEVREHGWENVIKTFVADLRYAALQDHVTAGVRPALLAVMTTIYLPKMASSKWVRTWKRTSWKSSPRSPILAMRRNHTACQIEIRTAMGSLSKAPWWAWFMRIAQD